MTQHIHRSTVLAALLAAHDRLLEVDFPPNVNTKERPAVLFLEGHDAGADEFVELVGKVPDVAGDPASLSPATRDETYLIQIRVGTVVADGEGREVIARLDELIGPIQDAWRYGDDDGAQAGRPKPLLADEDHGIYTGGGLERLEVTPFPNTDKGWAGVVDLYYRVRARI